MGQTTPIRVKKLVRVEIVSDEVELAYETDREQVVLVMEMPAFRDATVMQGAIINQ